MWTLLIQGRDEFDDYSYYVLVGAFNTDRECFSIPSDKWNNYLVEEYGNIQFEEIEGIPIKIRTNLCETIREVKK